MSEWIGYKAKTVPLERLRMMARSMEKYIDRTLSANAAVVPEDILKILEQAPGQGAKTKED